MTGHQFTYGSDTISLGASTSDFDFYTVFNGVFDSESDTSDVDSSSRNITVREG